MVRPTDSVLFLNALKACGGRASNPGLRARLGWSEEKYWRLHEVLYDEGSIEKGRGYGGTVILIPSSGTGIAPVMPNKSEIALVEARVQSPVTSSSTEALVESELYAPAKKQLESSWKKYRSLDETHIDIIASQGRRDTGGSWSRPDLVLIAFKTFEYLPDRVFEIHTFEIKPSYDVTVKGVMEALSHRESSTRAYVIYHTAGRDLTDFPEASRIEALAVRHGIGVFAAKDINDFDAWAEIVPALRVFPDPEDMETFIKRSMSDEAKAKIRKWMK